MRLFTLDLSDLPDTVPQHWNLVTTSGQTGDFDIVVADHEVDVDPLVLWREFAYTKSGSPTILKFRLRATDFLQAEQELVPALAN